MFGFLVDCLGKIPKNTKRQWFTYDLFVQSFPIRASPPLLTGDPHQGPFGPSLAVAHGT